METMTIRLLMILHIISRSALLMVNGQNTTFYVNAALGKRAWQSSTYVGNAKYGDTDMFLYDASLAVDGKVETNFRNNSCSSTAAAQSSAFWEVDLTNLYYITTIKIYQRSDALIDRNVGSVVSGKLQDDSYEYLTTLDRSGVLIFNTNSSHTFRGVRVNHSGTSNFFICLCEVQVFVEITCNMSQLNRSMGTYTCSKLVGRACAYQSILTIHCNTGYRLSGFNSSQCIDTDRWSRTIGVCEVKRCDKPPSQIAHGVLIFKGGLGGNGTYNTTVSLNCTEGYKLDNLSQLRCAEDEQYQGTLGLCLVIDCGQPLKIPGDSTIVFSTGLDGNTSYNATFTIHCNKGFRYTHPGNETIRCGNEGHWTGSLGLCEVIDCGQPLNIPGNSTIVFSTGLAGITSYSATFTIHCNSGFRYTHPGNETIGCGHEGHWTGYIGICEVTRCTEIVPPEYGVIVVEAGTGGRWSINTTVVIICNTGYSLNGETLIQCLDTGRWTNALGYCLALPEKNADEEECKTSVLGWVVTGPFCLILLVTNIATCLRFRRHKNSDKQTLNSKSNELENNAMEPYDNLQMEQIAKSEYDQLAFERESSLKTTMKNEI